MVYNRNIPQSTDLISISQGQILGNFQTIDSGTTGTGVGFSREHITMTDATNGGLHSKATMPDTASVSPPTSYGTYYASKTGSVPGNITEAVYKSGDGSSAVAILSATKAWGRFSSSLPGPVSKIDGFNFASVTNPSTGVYNISFTNALPNSTYSVLVTVDQLAFGNRSIAGATSLTVNGFTINVAAGGSSVGSPNGPINFMVLQS